MKWMPFLLLLLALLATINESTACGCRKRRFRIYTTQTKIIVKNGNIIVNGNCNRCDIRTTKNTAQLTIRG